VRKGYGWARKAVLSIYFAPGVKQEFSNWYVPAELDYRCLDLVFKIRTGGFTKQLQFDQLFAQPEWTLGLERTVDLLDRQSMAETIGLAHTRSVIGVAYQSENVLINWGKNTWTRGNRYAFRVVAFHAHSVPGRYNFYSFPGRR